MGTSALRGACTRRPTVRSSCLACLAHVAATLRLAIHPWATELLQIAHAALEGETDLEARRAACYMISTSLASLGSDAATVLPPEQLATLHRQLCAIRDATIAGSSEEDAQQCGHASEALRQMQSLGRALAKGVPKEGPSELRIDDVRLPPDELTIRMPGPTRRPAIEVLRDLTDNTASG